MKMRFSLIAILAAGAFGAFAAVNNPAAVAAPLNGTAIQDNVPDYFTPARIVYRCKINGRWRPGRCPLPDSQVTCVHGSGRYRHAGHC
jgi:hypothetical protein